MSRILGLAVMAALSATPATAGVVSASPNGFHVRVSEPLVAKKSDAFELMRQPALWWDGDHSYSGDATNFRLDLTPGGCFCEHLPGGGFVEHMRVLSFTPGEEIVLEGMLGPLRTAPATGVMTLKLEDVGANARITLDFKVVGFPDGDGATWAPIVDGVVAQQMKRLRTRAASGGSRGVPMP